MENHKEIRWKQRFSNFEKAFLLLNRTAKKEKLNEAEKAGLIQFFEITFELSWKIMKDYLESIGFITKSPRETIKQAYQAEIISNGHKWIDALEARNKTSHIYEEEEIEEISINIVVLFVPIIQDLYSFLKKENEK